MSVVDVDEALNVVGVLLDIRQHLRANRDSLSLIPVPGQAEACPAASNVDTSGTAVKDPTKQIHLRVATPTGPPVMHVRLFANDAASTWMGVERSCPGKQMLVPH